MPGSLPEPAGGDSNPLERYFDGNQIGPGIFKWRHYFDIYHRHLAKFIDREVHVLEIGVFSGGSLKMWREYFGERCHVYGVDIEPACRAYEDERIRIFIGDQADPRFWRDVLREIPAVDIVIDDGGHSPSQQIPTFEALIPHIRPGGVYVCEDAHGVASSFHAYMAGVSRHLHANDPHANVSEPTPMQQTIGSIHLYPFAVVVERPPVTLPPFHAARHGTIWEPHL